MQDRPTAAELLATLADLLEGDLLTATQGPLRHPVRVAGNLARILEREMQLGAEQDRREIEGLRALLGRGDGDAASLNAALTEALTPDSALATDPRTRATLIEIVRGKLAIAKPGHDAYDFADERPR